MAYSSLIDDIEKSTGKYSKDKKYYINNWSNEDITVKWGAHQPEAEGSGTYTIKSGELGGPYPQFIAYHITRHLVNREIIKSGKNGSIGNVNVRTPLELKTLREVVEGEEDPRISIIREQERAKLVDKSKKDAPTQDVSHEIDLPKKKVGRPRKEFEGANL